MKTLCGDGELGPRVKLGDLRASLAVTGWGVLSE